MTNSDPLLCLGCWFQDISMNWVFKSSQEVYEFDPRFFLPFSQVQNTEGFIRIKFWPQDLLSKKL